MRVSDRTNVAAGYWRYWMHAASVEEISKVMRRWRDEVKKGWKCWKWRRTGAELSEVRITLEALAYCPKHPTLASLCLIMSCQN